MHVIDTEYRVETPEGIDLSAELAGPIPRSIAFLIDLFFRLAVAYVAMIIIGTLNWATGPFLILYFLLEWFYPVLFEVLYNGQTPGKRLLSIAVVNDDLTPVTWNASIIRNFLRTADFLPLLYVSGLICMIINKHCKRLGDISAGTIVVYKTKKRPSSTLPDVTPTAPLFQFETEDQVAIIDFTERHTELSTSRKHEIATILKPIHGLEGEAAQEYIHKIGRWYLGGKD
jgi:uncharacterized RDD family membrane protein YckC